MTDRHSELPATPMARQIIARRSLLDAAKAAPVSLKVAGSIVLLGLLLVNALIGFIVVDGQLDGEWYDFRDLGYAMERLRIELDEVIPREHYEAVAKIISFVMRTKSKTQGTS